MVRIILFFIISINAYANSCLHESLLQRRDGQKYRVCFDPKRSGVVSESCLKLCQAYKFIENTVEIKSSELNGGKNPHTVACTKLNGDLYILKDENNSETSFCFAQDGSFISVDLIKFNLL